METLWIVLGIVLVAIVLLILFQPKHFQIERSILIHAGYAKIMLHLIDLKAWIPWSPFEKLDPEVKRSYRGPAKGKGAIYEWEGNKQVGHGIIEIIETEPEFLRLSLHFIEPFEAHNEALFKLTTQGDATELRWTMSGPNRFPFSLMNLLGMADRMIGGSFEKGLADLKKLAES